MSDERTASKALWDQMAPGWENNRDFMWDTTRHVGEWLAANVDARAGDTILDLAGGPGDNGFLVSDVVGPQGKVITTDFAPGMVEVARRSAEAQGLTNVETRVLDAENMDLETDSIDGIICRWGFMLMHDPLAALTECRRVLKDGRTLALSVWGGPEANPWVTVTGMTMKQMGFEPPSDPFGPGGMFSLADHDVLSSMLSEAGFEVETVEEMPVIWRYPSFDVAWSFMIEVAGAIAAAARELPESKLEELRVALEANIESFRTDEGLVLPGMTVNARAQ